MLEPPLRFVSLPGAPCGFVCRGTPTVSHRQARPSPRHNLRALMRIAAGKPTVVPSQR